MVEDKRVSGWVNHFQSPLYHKRESDSTMRDAKEVIDSSEESGNSGLSVARGTTCFADYQRASRGRLPQRNWHARPRESLLMTMILPKERDDFTLPLKVGLALAKTISLTLCEIPLSEIKIKWPNDLLIRKKKVAGILCEEYKGYRLVGIGVNLYQKNFPQELERKATSLFLEGICLENRLENHLPNYQQNYLPNHLDMGEFFSRLSLSLKGVLSQPEWLQDFQPLLFTNEGEPLLFRLHEEAEVERVVIDSLEEDGGLSLRSESGEKKRVYAGEFLYDSFL